jgi:transposase
VARDWRDDRIAELERVVSDQARTIAELTKKLDAALARVADLEEKLRRSSRNSSQPPSSDGPAVPPPSRTPRSGRRPGAQEGHDKHERPVVPADKVDKRVKVVPKHCRACHAVLEGEDPSPRRHQVFDLPPIQPIVTEWELHSLTCACGVRTSAAVPPEVPKGAFGPGVVATVAMLMGVYRLSKRAVPQLMSDLFGLSMSVGAVIGCQALASEALAAPVDEARAFVAKQPVKHADETGWREARRRAWLWTVVTTSVTVFLVHARRTANAARTALGEENGILVSDRFSGYTWWSVGAHQVCWAHLIRDFVKISERGGRSAVVGDALLEEAERMFAWWHRVRDATLARATFRVYMRSLQRRVQTWLREGEASAHPKTSKTCAKILGRFDALFTFVRIEGVEPTNNAAERAVRHAVLMRKMSHGTHSEAGSRFLERILTTHATLRQQQRNILAFLTDACRAKLRATAPPSLLPG